MKRYIFYYARMSRAELPPLLPNYMRLGARTRVIYTNYRGETAVRDITPQEVFVGRTEYHPTVQVLVRVWDHEKNAERIYAQSEIKHLTSEQVD